MDDAKVLIVSADGHVAAPMREYRSHIERRYLDAFDDYLDAYEQRRAGSRVTPPESFFDRGQIEPYVEYMVDTGAIDGESDVERRLKELGREGVAAEVLFPNGVPFVHLVSARPDPELHAAGNRAYNRWLADFVAARPDQFVGQAIVQFDDVEAAIATVEWAHEHGLRGVILPGVERDAARVHWDPALDPLWSALEDTGLTACVHGGAGSQFLVPPAGVDPRIAYRFLGDEQAWNARRPLRMMMWSGVFERHPRLKTVWTEQHSEWVPRTLARWDWSWAKDRELGSTILESVPRKPSEYWAQNCWVGLSLASKAEVDERRAVGVDKLMFGVDFPHVESTFPKTLHTIQTLAVGVPDDELRAFLGLNAAALWDLDLDALAPIVDEVGFTMAELRQAPPPDAPLNHDVHRPLGL